QPKAMLESIQHIKKLTDKPFGVNLFVPETPDVSLEEIKQANERLAPFREELNVSIVHEVKRPTSSLFDEQIDIVAEERVPVCSFTFGLPDQETVQRLKANQIIVIGTATTVEEALANEALGMDMVVMQGSEAGGHRGTFIGTYQEAMIGTTGPVPQDVDQLSIPVIGAGGVMDCRGVLSTLVLGAEAVKMGTSIVTCHESGAKQQHKTAIL